MSDSEICKFDWTSFNDRNVQNGINYSTKAIACVNNSCCYQCAAVTDNRQILAVATSKDNILLYNIKTTEQVFDYVGHTGYKLMTSHDLALWRYFFI